MEGCSSTLSCIRDTQAPQIHENRAGSAVERGHPTADGKLRLKTEFGKSQNGRQTPNLCISFIHKLLSHQVGRAASSSVIAVLC